METHRPALVLVTPALADANNGNWQTARRWAGMLAADWRVHLRRDWPSEDAPPDAAVMVALHARRSAAAVAAWHAAHPDRPLVLVLTGTDLYRDIAHDASAQRSLALATHLVVLNEHGAQALPAHLRARATVVLQSAPPRAPRPRPQRHLRALLVGHLREEKDPRTAFAAMRRLAARADIRLDHIGGALDPALGAEAVALAAQCPAYRWLGALPHAATRARIATASVLVHPSCMEGGAHAVIEALMSGTPVLASAIPGNTGLLGDDHPGLFPSGDDAALAALLQRCRDDPSMLPALRAHGDRRAPLFHPNRERQTLRDLLQRALAGR
jgi:putative glycosyltransferase (TIGR04348 family)